MGKISFSLCGYKGRMGQSIRQVAAAFDTPIEILPFVWNMDAKVDAVIDFSSGEGFDSALSWCLKTKTPLVSGTTGLGAGLETQLSEAQKSIPVLWSPNMSIGVQWLKSVLAAASSVERHFQFQIEEVHHQHKKDAPSGTALLLQGALEKAVGRDLPAPVSIRGGGVFGVHKVWAMGEDEVITLEHQALNRTVFARGAVMAALWLKDQSAGRYEMADVLGLRGLGG
jgi:4-hydroxy-tetrahydrodipicolinate reductase